jgi:integrase/recombinase XerD
MLTIYRRHRKDCPHRNEGRRYRRCRCPLWVDGRLNGVEIRKALGLRDWERAQQVIREWETQGIPNCDCTEPVTLERLCEAFLADAEARALQDSTLRKYQQLVKQIKAFAIREGLLFLKQWDLDAVRRFRLSWRDRGLTVVKKLERLRALFNFACACGWMQENPAMKLKAPVVRPKPTLPFSRDEMMRILAACEHYQGDWRRMKALVLLLRYSGLRIGDAVRLRRDRIVNGRVFLYTQKTGVPVWCPLPSFVLEALESFEPMNETYYFWSGKSSRDGVARTYMARLKKIFRLANIPDGHAHRFRDTFAVELLLAGVPLERVSILLGHTSIKVTERHYAPWVRARQEQLEHDVRRTWGEDPVLVLGMKGTPEVHSEKDLVN